MMMVTTTLSLASSEEDGEGMAGWGLADVSTTAIREVGWIPDVVRYHARLNSAQPLSESQRQIVRARLAITRVVL